MANISDCIKSSTLKKKLWNPVFLLYKLIIYKKSHDQPGNILL